MSCSNRLDKQDYINWVNDYSNGLHVKKQSGPFIFDVQYQPAPYSAILANSSPSGSDTTNVLQYYVLEIQVNEQQDILSYNLTNQFEKQKRIYYYSFLFQNDIFLEEQGEKMACVFFHFEQNDLNKKRRFLLGFEFPSTGAGKEAKLVIKSEQFGSVPIKINVNKDNIPEVAL